MPASPANKAERDLTPTGRACAICGKPALKSYDPFCSKRCADIDLHRWLSGSYAVPVVEDEDTTEDESGAEET